MEINDLFNPAIGNKNIKETKYLLNKYKNNLDTAYLIQMSGEFGFNYLIKFLLKNNTNPSFNNNYALRMASKNGHYESVKILLTDKRTDPLSLHNLSIINAAEHGYLNIVKLLFKDHRMKIENHVYQALLIAYDNNHNEVVDFLWKSEVIQKALKSKNKPLYSKLKIKCLITIYTN